MPQYEVHYQMTAKWTDIVEADSKEDAERLIRGDGYEIPEEPNEWEDFKIHWITEYHVYGFLCDDPKNPEYHAYGIEYSEYDDGECVFEVKWFPNKESRDAQVLKDKSENILFPREKWEIRYDDSGESERYGEGRWFVSDENGMVLGDASFNTKQEAEDFLKECLENGDA